MAARSSTDLYHGEISGQVIGAAIEVHRRLGPGMRFAQKKVGLVINFHAEHIRDGMKRLVL